MKDFDAIKDYVEAQMIVGEDGQVTNEWPIDLPTDAEDAGDEEDAEDEEQAKRQEVHE